MTEGGIPTSERAKGHKGMDLTFFLSPSFARAKARRVVVSHTRSGRLR